MQGDAARPRHSTHVAPRVTSTWRGNQAKLGKDQAHPGRQQGRQGVVGAQAVGVLLLAPLARHQEWELEAVPGERRKEQMGLARRRGP